VELSRRATATMAFMLWRVFFRKKYVASIKQTPFLNLKRAARALLYAFNIHTLVR
jgi:hypothetical protein